tara:strand:- start:2346 stop:2513 length:168 start_codon:yes stop_codon:yes gene_type:complete
MELLTKYNNDLRFWLFHSPSLRAASNNLLRQWKKDGYELKQLVIISDLEKLRESI